MTVATKNKSNAMAKKKASKSDRLNPVTPEEMEEQCNKIEDLLTEVRSLAHQIREAGFTSIEMDGSRQIVIAGETVARYAANVSRYFLKAKFGD